MSSRLLFAPRPNFSPYWAMDVNTISFLQIDHQALGISTTVVRVFPLNLHLNNKSRPAALSEDSSPV
jgi:hypothetical protein